MQRIIAAKSCIDLGIIAAALPLQALTLPHPDPNREKPLCTNASFKSNESNELIKNALCGIDWKTPFDHWQSAVQHKGNKLTFAVQSSKIRDGKRSLTQAIDRYAVCRMIGSSFQHAQSMNVRCKDPDLRIWAVIGEEILVALMFPKQDLDVQEMTRSDEMNVELLNELHLKRHPPVELDVERVVEHLRRNAVCVSRVLGSSGRTVVDVRSPSEFLSGHLPGALNIPLLDDDERHLVGQCYVKRGRDEAISLGKRLVAPKQRRLIDAFSVVRRETGRDGCIVYCARGGMRSGSVSWWLLQNGFDDVRVLDGGYKAFRRWCRTSFVTLRNRRRVCVIGGKTGAGKSRVLHALAAMGCQVLDLEALASHAGSAFGAVPFATERQPSNEQFANDLGMLWVQMQDDAWVFVEDEGSHIGSVSLPSEFYKGVLRSADLVIRLERSKQERAKNLVRDYASDSLRQHPEKWVATMRQSVHRLAKRLGKERCEHALELLDKEQFESFAELFLDYYDKLYEKHISVDSNGGPCSSRHHSAIIDVSIDGLSQAKAAARVLDAVDRFDVPEQLVL